MFLSGQAAAHVIGPLAISLTVLDHGGVGWVVLAAVFAVAGAAMPAAVRDRARITRAWRRSTPDGVP
ncbi:hypothetical protein ACFQ0M_36610 [Kitasatospora aburaviensis]